MMNGVKSRPNHYEALGLTPEATDDDISRSFVRKMSLFGAHPMDEAAQILIAYEALRNPAKRRDYDASLGLGAPEPRQWGFAVTPPNWAPFIASEPANRSSAEVARSPEPHVTAEPKPVIRDAFPKPQPAPRQQQRRRPDAGLEALIHHIRAVGQAEKESLREAGNRSPDWKKAAVALGGLVLGAGLIGTVAGLSASENQAPAQAEPSATPARPVAKRQPQVMAAPAPAPVAISAVETQVERPVRARRHVSRQRPTSWAERESVELGSASEPAATETQPAQTVAADLPLSNSLIARTIDKIGYACGQVASTTPADGEAQGVYKVTCSSGQSYKATRVHGRYRFRRLGGQ